MTQTNSPTELFEREKWETEKLFRERELALQEQEQANREGELALKRKEQASSGWRSPLVVAIIAATMAAAGNAVVSIVNGRLQRELESQKSEQARILEMIKTDADQAAENLDFLLKAGLITDTNQRTKLEKFLSTRKPGSGPSLPSEVPQDRTGGISGTDDAIDVTQLATGSGLTQSARAVGQIQILSKDNVKFMCTAFLVKDDLLLTASFCMTDATSAELVMPDGGPRPLIYKVTVPAVETVSNNDGLSYVLLKVDGTPGRKHGVLALSSQPPEDKQSLSLLMFRGSAKRLAVTGTPECRITKVEQDVFYHFCDTGAGASGSPVLSADGNQVVGLHVQSRTEGGMAVRMDRILSQSKILRSAAE